MRKTANEVKKAKGTHRKSREKTVVQYEPTSISSAPEDLSEGGKKIWNNVYPLLTSAQVLTDADENLLMMYCEEVAKYWQLKKELQTEDDILELTNGKGVVINYRINPKSDMADKALKNAQSIGAHFGLSPFSRTKITVTSTPKETPEQQNLNKLKELQGKIVPMKKTA